MSFTATNATKVNTIFYACKDKMYQSKEEFYCNIQLRLEIIRIVFGNKVPIFKIRIHEVKPGEVSKYWGWFDNKDNEYCMIYASKHASNMCFPYGPEAEEKDGRGRQVNLVVEEIEQVQ